MSPQVNMWVRRLGSLNFRVGFASQHKTTVTGHSLLSSLHAVRPFPHGLPMAERWEDMDSPVAAGSGPCDFEGRRNSAGLSRLGRPRAMGRQAPCFTRHAWSQTRSGCRFHSFPTRAQNLLSKLIM